MAPFVRASCRRLLGATVVTVAAPLLALVVGTCAPRAESRPPAAASLQLATRQSCGVLSGLDYNTACLAAVYVLVLDETRRALFETCQVLDEQLGARSPDLRTLLEQPIIDITGLSSQGTVTFEVRGFHDVGAAGIDPCRSPATTDNWLFWGESDPIDLAKYDDGEGAPLIRVVLDCRDCSDADGVFGCGGITVDDTGTCGPELPDAFCVPTVSCAKACDDSDDCFEGARACSEGSCDVALLSGGLCSPCGGAIACADDFVCVEKPGQSPFCAPPCPDARCPNGTKCNRRGNGLDLAD